MKTIRVGILLDSLIVPNWLYVALERIQDLENVNIVALIRQDPGRQYEAMSKDPIQILFSSYLFLEQIALKLKPNALKNKKLLNLFKKVPDIISEINTHRLEKLDLDVLLDLSTCSGEKTYYKYAAICLSIVSPSSWLSSDNQLLGFMETYEGTLTSQIALRIITQDGKEFLNNTFTSTNLLSYSRNRNRMLWTATQFYPRAIENIRDFGLKIFLKNASTKIFVGNSEEIPKIKQTELFLAPLKTIPRFLLKKIRRFLYRDQWSLFYTLDSDYQNAFLKGKPNAIIPSLDRFWADPHIIKKDQDHYIFFEELFYKNSKGHIAYFKIDQGGKVGPARKILEKPYHISYPYIFQYQNEYHMIPETAANGTVDLYQCLEFPQRWKWRKTLLRNLYAMDTTVLEWDGKWWLFTNIRGHKGASGFDELFLFYAEDLLSETWTPHSGNPIISDVRSARPAGKIFLSQGKLYRPSQDSSVRYGYGVKINQIDIISETEYQESLVEFIQPLWEKDLVATHTFSTTGELTIMDAAIRRRKF